MKEKLSRMGIDVPEDRFYTSGLATASFLASQKPKGSAYIMGESGLINALYNVGYTFTDMTSDYVVISETRDYNLVLLPQQKH